MKPTKKSRIPWNIKCLFCLVPSLVGITIFFVIPYFRVLYYSLIDNQFRRNFVWLDNYVKTIQNEYFQLAFKNSLLLILIAVPALILSSLSISLMLSFGLKKLRVLRTAFVLPLVIPTASAALIWATFFANVDNVLPVYLLFIWKNIGICIILMTAAFTCIDDSVFEAAKLDGAKRFTIHRKITIPLIMPTLIFSILISIVSSFKVFKETYLYYGGTNYPPQYSYTLQYYMNNNFLKLDYQSLAASAVFTSLLVFVIVIIGLLLQRRYTW
ncbi:MAG: sugar ABC transporter permease [Oscillospiraceae bacterium]|nr:sugar ABC transporter permease [Oscillospiraceae bacterium]